MALSLRTFRVKQPKKSTSDELLQTHPEIGAQLEELNSKYIAASQHYKRCINKLGSYLLASKSDKANEMKVIVNDLKKLKAELINKRKDLERKLILEEARAIIDFSGSYSATGVVESLDLEKRN